MSNDKEVFEEIYVKPDAGWTWHNPPPELSGLIESGEIKPCKAIDIGCGEGYYSIYLASKGFDMVGIDLSERAIAFAKENAAKANLFIRFCAMDINSLDDENEKFDFVFEWSVLHHIMPPQREHYVENVSRMLNKGGKYLSTCFSRRFLRRRVLRISL